MDGSEALRTEPRTLKTGQTHSDATNYSMSSPACSPRAGARPERTPAPSARRRAAAHMRSHGALSGGCEVDGTWSNHLSTVELE